MSDKESLWPHIAYIAAHHRDCNDSDKAEGVTVGDLRAWRDEIEHIHLENAKLTAAAEVEPLYKMKGKLDEDTHRLWRAINGLDIDDFDKRAEAFVHSMLDGLTVGPGNRATVKSALAENFEQLAKDRTAVEPYTAQQNYEILSEIVAQLERENSQLRKELAAFRRG